MEATQRPRIEAYLDQAPLELRSSLLTELLAVELQHRRELGDEAQLDEYLDRFPDLREEVCAAFQRASSGDTVSSVKRRSEETFPTSHAPRVCGTTSVRGDASLDPCGFPHTPRFVNKGLLGEGGMGRVYRAFDTDRGQDVRSRYFFTRMIPDGCRASKTSFAH